MTNNPV